MLVSVQDQFLSSSLPLYPRQLFCWNWILGEEGGHASHFRVETIWADTLSSGPEVLLPWPYNLRGKHLWHFEQNLVWFLDWKSLNQTSVLRYHCSFQLNFVSKSHFFGLSENYRYSWNDWPLGKNKQTNNPAKTPKNLPNQQAPPQRYTICELERRASSQC